MAKYVLLNRRAGKFTADAKIASRAMVAVALGMLTDARVISDDQPEDDLARRVVLLDVDPRQVASVRAKLPADAILEPAVQRHLHRQHQPMELRNAVPQFAKSGSADYSVVINGGGRPLAAIDVIFYLRDSAGQLKYVFAKTDATGRASVKLGKGIVVSFVEPIPYAGYWMMLKEAPASGSTIECTPIAGASASGSGWWHDAMGIKGVAKSKLGTGIKVGVIDTGCGPHPNLAHVTLAGTFVDGKSLPAAQAGDVGEHGTHTTGIIGARPTKAGDYAGLAPACDLYHARVFKSEKDGDGPTQADLIHAIDRLSRDNGCDLINMSLGGGASTAAEEDAIRDAAERGTLCICSAGNDAGPIDYPGAYPECAAVAAMGRIGWAPSDTFSAGNRPQDPDKLGRDNFFLAAFSCFGSGLACLAPGVGIVSTVPDMGGRKDLYMEMDGTSMASPAACAALAAILSQDSQFKALPRDISRTNAARQALVRHCQSVGLRSSYEGRGLPEL